VQLIAERKYRDAFLVARSPNPLASVCGRICAAPCEDACRRKYIDAPITIRALKRFVTEKYGAESTDPDSFKELLEEAEDKGCHRLWHLSELRNQDFETNSRKVAVIGSGPAGVGCAHDLALMGYAVTVFESLPHPGGQLRYGIPEYRLPRGVIDREVDMLTKLGVEIKTNTPLTKDFNLQTLRDQGYAAIFLSIGAMQGRDLNIPGSDKDGCLKADTARSVVREFYEPMDEIERTAEAVVGQPALDAARGAIRGGASEVHVISLESFEEMPATQTTQGNEELHQAQQEGIVFHPSWGPKTVIGNAKVTGIELQACTRVFDEEGRFNPKFDAGKTMRIDAESVILAIGQQVNLDFVSEKDSIETTRAGTIKIDPETLATSAPGIFAGGDAAFGPRIAIEAVANGKTAAQSIHLYLTKSATRKSVSVQISRLSKDDYSMFADYENKGRKNPDTIDTGRRTGIAEVEQVFDESEAVTQAERCLVCHIDTIYNPDLCVLCGRCSDVCPEKCLMFVPLADVDMPAVQKQQALQHYGYQENETPMTALLKDDTKCIRCGLCAVRCPTEAMTMEKFNFIEHSET
jgi:NADPH-dependent glutamate synthase beta subunit-like oxidoreductase